MHIDFFFELSGQIICENGQQTMRFTARDYLDLGACTVYSQELCRQNNTI